MADALMQKPKGLHKSNPKPKIIHEIAVVLHVLDKASKLVIPASLKPTAFRYKPSQIPLRHS